MMKLKHKEYGANMIIEKDYDKLITVVAILLYLMEVYYDWY